MELDPTALGFEFGGGAFIGAIMGYAAKKIAKLIAVLVGVQLVVFRYLESQGIIIVDWDALTAGIVSTSEYADPSYLESLVSTLSIGAGFTTGFLVGFRRA